MKTIKRTIGPSVKTSAAYQRILADKQALRESCAAMSTSAGLLSHEREGIQSVSVR